jgi:hypothetical protein
MKIPKFKIRHQDPMKVWKRECTKSITFKNGSSCGSLEYVHPDDVWKWKINTFLEKLFGTYGDDFVPKSCQHRNKLTKSDY